MNTTLCTVARGGHFVLLTAHLPKKDWDAIEAQLLKWFNDKNAISRMGDALRFNAGCAGRGADALAEKVEGFFTGYCLRMKR